MWDILGSMAHTAVCIGHPNAFMNLRSPFKSLRAWVKSIFLNSTELPGHWGSMLVPYPSRMPVQDYANMLLRFVEGCKDPVTAQALFPVCALHHLKNLSVAEHEYLAVEFSVRDATVTMKRKGGKWLRDKKNGGWGGRVPKTWYMVFERTISSPNDPKAALRSMSSHETYPLHIQRILDDINANARETGKVVDDDTSPPLPSASPSTSSLASTSVSSLSSSSPSSGPSSSSLSPSSWAIDQVYFLEELPTENVQTVASVTLPPQSELTLLRLAFIAAHLHTFEPVYSLLFHQCYWYPALLALFSSRRPSSVSSGGGIRSVPIGKRAPE
ncbi:hypothetical protein BXZ70DRAFT_493711 [Cristinia sonorae]|uniref:Uncharacterized protein n=1 Tax=Cristinia sonorae TaxID=1940300 RepID=A0A8K0UHK6_9AGAR|nr:hypothetical protein BXZ70DRAFT_493711 [Cristinia sonorae]